jgi:hypothetical protein
MDNQETMATPGTQDEYYFNWLIIFVIRTWNEWCGQRQMQGHEEVY